MKRTLFHLNVECELDMATLILNALSQFDGPRYKCSLWTSEEEDEPSTTHNDNDYRQE